MATVSSVTTGDIVNSVFAVGDNNVILNNVAAGARITINKPDARPKYWLRPGPVEKLLRPFPALLGREGELELMRKAVQDSQPVSVWAPKGMGKTAITRRFTRALREEDAARSVVHLDVQNMGREDILQALFDLFFDSVPSYVPGPATIPNALSKVKGLIALDNLGLSADEVESLVNDASGCAFILISAERLLSGEGRALPLPGLPAAAALELFEKSYGAALAPADRESFDALVQRLRGSPDEIIRIAQRGAEQKKSFAQLLGELDASDDRQAADSAAVAGVTETGRELLAFLAAAGENAVPTAALQSAFPGIDVPHELERLTALNLVQSHSPRYSLCGSLSTSLAQMWDLDLWQGALFDTSVDWLSRQSDPATVTESFGMLMQALTGRARQQDWSDVLRLGRMLEPWLIAGRRWQAWFDVLNLILRAAQGLGDRMTEGWALHQLGSRALFQGALDPARSFLARALQIRRSVGDRAGIEVTEHNLQVLKLLSAPPRGTGSGGRPLTYSFFGFAGLLVLAAAAYMVTHRNPPATPPPPVPPAITTFAPVTSSSTPSLTLTVSATPSLTPTSTQTPTETPTLTPTSLQGPFAAVVIADQYLFCHYGPGSAYEIEWTLGRLDEVLVIGRAETSAGPYVLVRYEPKFGVQPRLPCWVDPQFLDLQGGDISALPQPYPDKAPLIQWDDPKFVPYVFPPPTDVAADRYGNLVSITWTGKNLADGDREDPKRPIFLAELWTCQGGKFLLTAIGYSVPYDDSQPFVSGYAEVQDDPGCSEPSHGWVWLAHKDGYVGPSYVKWP